MPPSEFKENAESLNTAESVQVDVNPSLTKTELDAFASLLEVEIPGTWARSERNALIAAYITAARRLFAEVESRGRAIEALSARLTAKNAELDKTIQGMLNAGAEWAEKIGAMRAERDEAIREAAADKAKLAAKLAEAEAQIEAGRRVEKGEPCPECGGTVSPWRDVWGKVRFHACTTCTWPLPSPDGTPRTAPEMPRPPAEEERDENAFDRGFGNCPHCRSPRVAHCHECLNDIERDAAHAAGWRMDHLSGFGCIALCPDCRGDDRTPVPPAQERVPGPETSGTGSGRGTGVAEAPGTAQASDG